MLGTWRAHTEFQAFLVSELAVRRTSDRSRIEHHAGLLEAAWLLNLDPALPILTPHYSLTGRPGNQLPEVLRSLLLMTFAGQTSILQWHTQLLGEPILAIACGFTPGRVAAVSSFYYLCNRLWPILMQPSVANRR